MDDFSEMQEVMLVSQRLVFMLEKSSPCLPLRRTDWVFLVNLPSPSRHALLVKREYQCSAEKQRLHTADHFTNRTQHRPDQQQTPHTRMCPSTSSFNSCAPCWLG